MTYTMGWFSTGRDEAARELLQMVYENISSGVIPGRIGYVFCSRRPGETLESDRFIELVKTLDIKVIFVSSSAFDPHLRLASPEIWRAKYHEEVMNRVQQYKAEVIVLAGYMLIVSPEMCRRYTMINLHPAAPGGPKGTWQEVVWQLIDNQAEETGVMMHLATPELDEGPPATYCTFPIRGKPFDRYWTEIEGQSVEEIKQSQGERNRLFKLIRKHGLAREFPLIIATLKVFSRGKVRIKEGKVVTAAGKPIKGYNLTSEIDKVVKGVR